jgi:single-stranded-DNA-specific exonuclease
MMELSEITSSFINEEHIGFTLGPRLNALGRLGDANPAVELLTTSNPIRARVLATQLEGLNVQRKLLCDQVIQAAESQIRENPSLLAQPIIILSHPSWPGGVVEVASWWNDMASQPSFFLLQRMDHCEVQPVPSMDLILLKPSLHKRIFS